ncbi:MAG: hypothetical protein PUC15_02965 [Lentisphaeria bacterium]|nr:hypothetical protein [Lentisphaeria bacterium]
MNQFGNNGLRMSVVRWLGRHLAIDIGETLSANEYNLIMKTLRDAAKKGETKEPDVPLRLVDGREAADILGISYSQFRALESEGVLRIPRKMLGKKTVRYRLVDLQNFILSDDATEKGPDDGTDSPA